jgi:hypothetical protein
MRKPDTTHTIAIGVAVTSCIAALTAIALHDTRPLALAVCLAWLGAEYLMHVKEQARRRD